MHRFVNQIKKRSVSRKLKQSYVPMLEMSLVGIGVAIALARRSHCLSRVAIQRFAPNARPEFTSGL